MPSSSPPDAPADPAAQGEAEAKAAFHLRMRARGIRDLAVLRAFELVPRQTFVPHRYLDLAMRDLALPIGCGQTLDEPWLIARMIEALDLRPTHRVLQVGAGTGYASAILAQLAGEVVAFERYRSLAESARDRLAMLDIANATVTWGDGLAASAEAPRFDRILVHGLLSEPVLLTDRLVDDGVMVCAQSMDGGQTAVRITRAADGFAETAICPCRFQPIVPGVASAL